MKTQAAITAALTAGIMLAATYAFAQDKGPNLHDHDWIMNNPAYTMPNSSVHCCDKSHCRPLKSSDIQITKTGYLYKPTNQTFEEGQPGVYTSETMEYMGCGHGHLWCFFIARGGV